MSAKLILRHDRRGAALVEFALVAPLFLLLLVGMVAYGAWFWRAHALQQVANDAARAALGGLTAVERSALATAVVASEAPRIAGVPAAAPTVTESGDTLTVELTYDGRRDALLGLGVLPVPDRIIRRRAAVRLAGL